MIARNDIYIYFPASEKRIASRLVTKLDGMLLFLKGKGFSFRRPLHITLDDKLDRPHEHVHVTPHRGIRIPLKAPGVTEDGFLESDPWSYFLFRGLCRQGIYSIRGGIPKLGYHICGEIVTPNLIMPNWVEDGICAYLYAIYAARDTTHPVDHTIFQTSTRPLLSNVSNHTSHWPGYFSYRIFGRPFIRWLSLTYGWDAVLHFLKIHGSGVIPIEIDLKAIDGFGKTWSVLWDEFTHASGLTHPKPEKQGVTLFGYWPDPFIYWNFFNITPGQTSNKFRGRYGFFDSKTAHDPGTLLISAYDADNIVRLTRIKKNISTTLDMDHVFDPGMGYVAICMKGSQPEIILLPTKEHITRYKIKRSHPAAAIPAPPGAIQLSGPVRNKDGAIAVSANINGNWDIWVYNGRWRQITSSPAIEMDPWWDDNGLIFASNLSGKFQVYTTDMIALTHEPWLACLPRQGYYLTLTSNGWQKKTYQHPGRSTATNFTSQPISADDPQTLILSEPYTPFKSILPNYWRPDIFVGDDDLHVGLVTSGRDVSGNLSTQLGLRYITKTDYITSHIDIGINDFGCSFSRYPLTYKPRLKPIFQESRQEYQLFWQPDTGPFFTLQAGLTQLIFEPLTDDTTLARQAYNDHYSTGEHVIFADKEIENWSTIRIYGYSNNSFAWLTSDFYAPDRVSLYGGMRLFYGKKIYSMFRLEAGHTWGDVIQGHGTFRVGGDVGEGFFTKRPSKLFPLRGFASNLLEANSAAAAGIEIVFPLFRLGQGYKTLPLFLQHINIAPFIDIGACQEHLSGKDTLVGAGVEFITNMEIAWEMFADFRFGIAWPLHYPDYYPENSLNNPQDLNETEPELLIQFGMPL